MKTDLEIVSALKQCIENGDCEKCPYDDGYGRAKMCVNEVMTDALNLIIDLNEKLTKKPEGNIREIVKSLRTCLHDHTTDDCSICPYKNVSGCIDVLMWAAADVIEIQDRKIRNNTAEWLELNVPTCSNCGYVGYTNFYGRCKTKFCPECGCAMSGAEK